MSHTDRITLISNGSATSAGSKWPGGYGSVFQVEATWSGATIKLQKLSPNGTWIDIPGCSLTADGQVSFVSDGALLRAAVTGGPPSGVYAYVTSTGDVAHPHSAAIEALLTTIDADTGAIKTATETIDNAISGSEMQVDVVAALPAGDNNIGNVDIVGGGVASGAADSGNPVKVGGVYNSALPTFSNGQRGDLQITDRGALVSALYLGANAIVVLSAADGSGGQSGVPTTGRNQLFNESTFDRQRGNINATILASAARTASVDSADQTNYNSRGVVVVIDVTAVVDTPSLVVTIQGKDALSGKYYTILVSAAITGVGTTVLRVYPGLTTAANLVANDVLPRTWRVSVAAADSDSITYSIGASVIL